MTKGKLYSIRVLSVLLTFIMVISIFSLGVSTVSAADKETHSTAAGNSIANATEIPLNSNNIDGAITDTNESDFYKFIVPNDSSIEFSITLTSYMQWVYLNVYNVEGNEILSKNPNWNSNINQITETYTLFLDPGTYYIGIIEDYRTGNYSLSTSYNKLNNLDLSDDDTIATAHNIDLTTSFTGVLTNEEESDIYRLNVTNSGILDCEFSAYMKWVYLKLIDAQGNEILSENPNWNDNIGYSVNTYSFALEKGTYYLQVFDDGYSGKYQFINKFTKIGATENEKNDTIATANSVSLGEDIVGLLGEDEESDIYKISIPSNGTVNVSLQAYMKWVNLIIYTANGEELYSENPYWNGNLLYSNNNYEYTLSAGTYYFQIKSDGSSRGKYNLRIVQPNYLNSTNTKISSIPTKVYTGKDIVPSVTVKYGSLTLKKDRDYSISYSNNRYAGTATVTITGIGDYTGTVYKTFKIIPKSVSIKKLKNVKNRSLLVKWSENKDASGYRIVYATNSKFKKAKSSTISRGWFSATKSTTLYNLKKGKTYYVKIQAYNVSNGKIIYSKYSQVKQMKINK